MAFDVASGIKKLLFEKKSIIIPGFGAFVLEEKGANIDYIKSQITPPSKVPFFQKDLTLNDGVLLDFIKRENQCSLDKAKSILDNFIGELKRKIEKKEIIEFPKVGRLYKDYNKQLQFLPYDTNFNTDVFGLPVIEARPFSRDEEVKSKAAVASSVVVAETAAANIPNLEAPKVQEESAILNMEDTTAPPNRKDRAGFLGLSYPMLALAFAAIGMVLLTYFMLLKNNKSSSKESTDKASMELDESIRLNKAPTDPNVEELPDAETDEAIGNIEDEMQENENDIASDSDQSGAATNSFNSTGSNECVVIVGQFSSKRNADKYASKIENEGFESYQGWNSNKEMNMVGVKFSYETETDKQDMINHLKTKYDDTAWVYKE